MSYRLMKWLWAAAIAVTVFLVGRDVIGPGVWRSS